jgi:hypothetical protein
MIRKLEKIIISYSKSNYDNMLLISLCQIYYLFSVILKFINMILIK